MRRLHVWIALGLGAYIAFALSMFPAAAAYRWFAPETLRLAGVEGTLWSGRAALASAGGLPLRDLRWSLAAPALLTGRAAARVEAGLSDGFVNAHVTATATGRIELRDVQLSTSVAALAPVAPVGDVRGQVSATFERIVIVDERPTAVLGNGRIAELRAPAVVPGGGAGALLALGDYTIDFVEPDGDRIVARFADAGGPLEVSGTLTLDPAGNYAIDAMAAARPDAPGELVQALELMGGSPGPDGMRPLELSGSL